MNINPTPVVVILFGRKSQVLRVKVVEHHLELVSRGFPVGKSSRLSQEAMFINHP